MSLRPSYLGGATTYATQHRAYARLDGAGGLIGGAVLLTAAVLAGWLAVLPALSRAWGHALLWLTDALGVEAPVVMTVHDAWGLTTLGAPHVVLQMALPGTLLLFAVGLVTAVLWIATHFVPETLTPGIYLTRLLCIVQGSAVLYFALWADHWPYTLPGYLETMTVTALCLTTVVIPVLGLTYYIQDVTWTQKVFLTALCLGYSAVLVPVQFLAHALVLSKVTALFLPVVYLFFGIPLHVLALVALYAWGMSWPGRLPALGTPVAPLPDALSTPPALRS